MFTLTDHSQFGLGDMTEAVVDFSGVVVDMQMLMEY